MNYKRVKCKVLRKTFSSIIILFFYQFSHTNTNLV